MTTEPKVKGPASYFPAIEKKYGRTIAEWTALIRSRPQGAHMEYVSWLKIEHGMGHGHANALVAHTLAEDTKPKSEAAYLTVGPKPPISSKHP